MRSAQRWQDLKDRTIWGLGMAAVGVASILAGGIWFQMVTVFVTAVMIWELYLMIAPQSPTPGMLLAALTASLLSGMLAADQQWGLLLFLLPPVLGTLSLSRERLTFFVFALAILVAGWGLVSFRNSYGMIWLLWLVLVVIATDVAGYFAGRTLGGPKFWPAVSPSKTWSGTTAGWLAAAAVGGLFLMITDAGRDLIWISALVSFASQMGDAGESALKRRMGVKDSSTLIPGHGGLFDRFDGLLGAALLMLLTSLIVDVPEVVL